ncbi:MAG: YceI family protein, partial [Luteimonas sp.]
MNNRNRTFRRLALAAALSLSTAAAFAAPVTYTMDPDHTTVAAKWNHFGFSNPVILFGDIDGSIVYDADNVSASSVQVTLPLSGLESNVQAFNDHLLSDDFFDAEQFPEATFRSTSVEADGDDELKITGDLTIKGITREVVLEADINLIGEHPATGKQTA